MALYLMTFINISTKTGQFVRKGQPERRTDSFHQQPIHKQSN